MRRMALVAALLLAGCPSIKKETIPPKQPIRTGLARLRDEAAA